MKSRLLLGGLCIAVALVGPLGVVQPASADVFTGHINAGKSVKFSLTTDTSTLLQLHAIFFHPKADPDILITTGTGSDLETLLDSKSGVLRLEIAGLGVAGATKITITLTNNGPSRTRFALTITEIFDAGSSKGASIRLQQVGGFDADGAVSSDEDRALQLLVRQQRASKGLGS